MRFSSRSILGKIMAEVSRVTVSEPGAWSSNMRAMRARKGLVCPIWCQLRMNTEGSDAHTPARQNMSDEMGSRHHAQGSTEEGDLPFPRCCVVHL
jgi:hypothetical protein